MKEIQKIRYRNSSKEVVYLTLEPWGEEYLIDIDNDIDIIATSDTKDGFFEIESLENRLIIYGWSGCIIKIYKNGKLMQQVQRCM